MFNVLTINVFCFFSKHQRCDDTLAQPARAGKKSQTNS